MAGFSIGRIAMRVLAALVLLTSARAAFASIGAIGQPVPVCVARAEPGMTAEMLLRRPGGFDCTTPQTEFGSGDFWVRSQPLDRVDTRSAHEIRIASLWQKRITLYALYGDGRIFRFSDDGRGASRHLQLGAMIQHQTPRSTAPLVRLLWHVEGSANLRGIVVGAHVATSYQAGLSNLRLGAIYAGFVGLCVALLIYNFALWAALRYRFQIPYGILVGALMLYAVSSSGALAWAFPGIDNNDRLRINYLLLAVSGAAAVAFARSFFEERVFAGWLRPASHVVTAAVLAPAAALAIFAPAGLRLLDRAYATGFVLLVSIIVPVLWRAWQRRSNFLWLFAVGWATPIAFAAVRIANNFNLIPWSFWLDNSTIAAMVVEALVSTLAVAYRMRLLSRERDDARIQEAAARLLADTDPLTGLLNRRAFLREAIGRTGDQTLLIADIDHFKRVNDTLGHDGGDEVLRLFARALKAAAPPGALVARIGGEEFAIVAAAEAGLEAEPILARLRAERMPFDLTVTASIGTCAGPLETEAQWKLLYRFADRALFDAKADGRDRARSALAVAYAA
jgi:diguanylate cyclase (GGDEF)-like protein